jgi:hypothetical protein
MTRALAALGLAALFAFAPPAQAQTAPCSSNGELVPHGTRIGPNVCVNGQWVYSP